MAAQNLHLSIRVNLGLVNLLVRAFALTVVVIKTAVAPLKLFHISRLGPTIHLCHKEINAKLAHFFFLQIAK